MKKKRSPAGRKPQRPARRERAIYLATLEELARSDYGALSMESVAARAGVNKTTLYRRWPSKAVLVQAALDSIVDAFDLEGSSGSLRGDLLVLARRMLEMSRSPEAQSLVRLNLIDQPEPDLARIAARLQTRRQAQLTSLLKAAVARGELRAGTDLGLVLDLLGGMIHVRSTVKKMRVDDRLLERAVDLLVDGISPNARGR